MVCVLHCEIPGGNKDIDWTLLKILGFFFLFYRIIKKNLKVRD